MSKRKNFSDYTAKFAVLPLDQYRSIIADFLKSYSFYIHKNSNSHNYIKINEGNRNIKFNSVENYKINYGTAEGIFTSETGYIGNNINFRDLEIIILNTKKNILDDLSFYRKEIKNLQFKEQGLVDRLNYLIQQGKEEFTEEEFKEFRLEKITNIKLREVEEEVEEILEENIPVQAEE